MVRPAIDPAETVRWLADPGSQRGSGLSRLGREHHLRAGGVTILGPLRQRAPVTEDEEKIYYQQHIDSYKLEDRAHVAHILFKTVGKTDAEVAEIKAKAEDVLNKARHGAKFADLAKQYSEDSTK